jgi:hypothetical protein
MKRFVFFVGILLSGTAWGQASVNHATGSMSANIPIYTLQEGSLSVPISLGYDGSGVQVTSPSSTVGLNWQLNAGGVIVRTQRFAADESINATKIGTYKGYLHEGMPTSDRFAYLKDWEPDIFTMVLSGQVVSFVLKKQNSAGQIVPVILNDNTDISIEAITDASITIPNTFCSTGTYDINLPLHNLGVNQGLSSFVVTTSDGIRYYFGKNMAEREYVFSKKTLDMTDYFLKPTNSMGNLSCPTAWYLSRIEYPKSGTNVYQSISFNYARRIRKYRFAKYAKTFSSTTAACADLPKYEIDDNSDENFTFACELNTIISDNTEIRFNDASVPIPTNILDIIPDHTTNQFSNFNRQDVPALNFPASVIVTCQRFKFEDPTCSNKLYDEACYEAFSKTIPNPFASLAKSQALNNIVIIDKTSQRRMGYYLNHDYFMEYLFTSPSIAPIDSRLNLRGVYPLQFDASNSSTKLLAGHSFLYHGKTLASKMSLAQDAWGYQNGANINDFYKIGYKVIGPPVTCSEASAGQIAPQLASALNGALYSTKLPTGGVQYYTYELHDCFNYGNPVGGLRINAIRNLEPLSGNESITSYSYKKPDGITSSGHLSISPFYFTSTYTINVNEKYIIQPDLFQSIQSRFTNGSSVVYQFVKEEFSSKKTGQALQSTGYLMHEFYIRESINPKTCKWIISSTGQWTFQYDFTTNTPEAAFGSLTQDSYFGGVNKTAPLPKYEPIRGLLKSSKVYSSANVLQQETTQEYMIEDLTNSSDLKAGLYLSPFIGYLNASKTIPQPVITLASYGGMSPEPIGQFLYYLTKIFETVNLINGTTIDDQGHYTIYYYKVPVYRVRPEKTTSRTYDPSGANTQPIEFTTTYSYESTAHKQATKVRTDRTTTSNTGLVVPLANLSEQQIKYSADYTLPTTSIDAAVQGLIGLKNRKMLVPIEQVSIRNNKVVGGSISQYYGTVGNEGLLQSVHALELLQPLSSITLSSVTAGAFIKNTNYKRQSQIKSYNTRALPTEVASDYEGASTTIAYGINDFMPTQVNYGTNGKLFSRKTEYAIPMFGASKSTSIDNSFTTATYDELGRIKEVKDHNGHLVKSYTYNYAAVPAPNNAISFSLNRTIDGSTPMNNDVPNLTDGAIISRAATMPNLTKGYAINACTSTAAVDGIEVLLTGPVNSADSDVGATLSGSCGNTFAIFTYNGSYTLEAKAYKNGVIVSQKKITFTITN